MIAERGLANTRTADVAAAAGVSQALVFYHFTTKEQLLAKAFAFAAEQDLARLGTLLAAQTTPLEKLRKIIKVYAPGGARPWAMWIDCWAEAMRMPELEQVSRRLDLRWRDALAEVIAAGVAERVFVCADPTGAAWRVAALMDGLAVQVTVHERIVSRKQMTEWIRVAVAGELAIAPDQL